MSFGVMDIMGYLSSNDKPKEKSENGIFGKILNFVGIGSKEGKEATDVKEKAKTERAGFFGELGKSLLNRQMPGTAAFLDLPIIGTGIRKLVGMEKGPEVYPLQNEIDSFLAIMRFTPNFLKHHLTDPLANSSIFQTIIANYPKLNGVDLPIIGPNGKLTEKVKAKDPDAIVEALRIIHQDICVGLVSFDKVKGLF